MIKLVAFDLDGTILDTIYDLHNCLNYVLNKYNLEEVTLEETKKNIGNGIKNLILRSLKGNDSNIDNMFSDFIKYYEENYNLYTKPYDGIYELLDYLKSKNVIIGVITNKKEEIAKKLIDYFYNNYFDFVIGDNDMKRKPSKDKMDFIRTKYNLKADEILYIGDSNVDFEFVNNSNVLGYYVSYGYRDKKMLEDIGAKPLFDDAYSLLEELKIIYNES